MDERANKLLETLGLGESELHEAEYVPMIELIRDELGVHEGKFALHTAEYSNWVNVEGMAYYLWAFGRAVLARPEKQDAPKATALELLGFLDVLNLDEETFRKELSKFMLEEHGYSADQLSFDESNSRYAADCWNPIEVCRLYNRLCMQLFTENSERVEKTSGKPKAISVRKKYARHPDATRDKVLNLALQLKEAQGIANNTALTNAVERGIEELGWEPISRGTLRYWVERKGFY